MEHNEQSQRNGAAEDFQKSLDQLQHILEENQTEEQPEKESEVKNEVENTELQPEVEESPKFNLADWEDAVADIEQYFESKDKQN